MLAAISLDNEPTVHANEIDDIGPDWNLSSELEAAEAPVANDAPRACAQPPWAPCASSAHERATGRAEPPSPLAGEGGSGAEIDEFARRQSPELRQTRASPDAPPPHGDAGASRFSAAKPSPLLVATRGEGRRLSCDRSGGRSVRASGYAGIADELRPRPDPQARCGGSGSRASVSIPAAAGRSGPASPRRWVRVRATLASWPSPPPTLLSMRQGAADVDSAAPPFSPRGRRWLGAAETDEGAAVRAVAGISGRRRASPSPQPSPARGEGVASRFIASPPSSWSARRWRGPCRP